MPVEGVVLEGQCANIDAAGLGHGQGCLGTELVFLVGLIFVDAGHAWFVEAVDLACVGSLLALNAVIEVKSVAFRTASYSPRTFVNTAVSIPPFVVSNPKRLNHDRLWQLLLSRCQLSFPSSQV